MARQAAAADGFAAIDLCVEKLEQQLHKAKTKQVPRKARRPEPLTIDAEAS